VQPGQIGVEVVGAPGQLSHRALDEVAGEGSFRKDQEVGGLGVPGKSAEQLTQAGQVARVGPFQGLELGDRETEHPGR